MSDTTTQYQQQFRGFPTLEFNPAALAIPLVDTSWHNDSCPRFTEGADMIANRQHLSLFIDFEDDNSEYYGTEYHNRFCLITSLGHGDVESQTTLYEGSSLADLTAAVLAEANRRAETAVTDRTALHQFDQHLRQLRNAVAQFADLYEKYPDLNRLQPTGFAELLPASLDEWRDQFGPVQQQLADDLANRTANDTANA